jgi:hypothetical protein
MPSFLFVEVTQADRFLSVATLRTDHSPGLEPLLLGDLPGHPPG